MVFFATRGLLGPSGTNAGDIDVGTEVILNENGQPVNYLIVNQGIPENSPLYDASCEGTWLLRKDIAENRQWHSSNSNSYKASTIHTYLNGDWLDRYDPTVAEAIVQVKIPYVNGTGGSPVASGTNGLSVKAFLLGGYEVGFTTSDNEYFPVDGAKLSYFESGTGSSALNKRIAKLNGSATNWWLRSPFTDSTNYAWLVYSNGDYNTAYCTYSYGIRPTLILPYEFKFTSDQIVA